MPSVSNGRPIVKFAIWLLAISMIIVALAQPQFGSKLTLNKRKGVELVIALDVSNSMKAQDIKPQYLDRAKRAIAKLTGRLSDDKIGLIVFAGQAYVQLPITPPTTLRPSFFSKPLPPMWCRYRGQPLVRLSIWPPNRLPQCQIEQSHYCSDYRWRKSRR